MAGLGANGTRRMVITAFFAGTAVIPVTFVTVAGRRTVVASHEIHSQAPPWCQKMTKINDNLHQKWDGKDGMMRIRQPKTRSESLRVAKKGNG